MNGEDRWKILRLHVEDQIPLAALARDTGISPRTLQRWNRLYKASGADALDRHSRSDARTRRTDAATVAFIERLALTRPRPSLAGLHRLAASEAGKSGLPAPSYAAVREIVQALDPALVTLALEGPGLLQGPPRAGLPSTCRPAEPDLAGGPHRTGHPHCGSEREAGPALADYRDGRSFQGNLRLYGLNGAPSALNTALALRQAIWRKSDPAWAMCGIPDILHVDHGSDFTSNHLERTAIDLHIRLIYSTIARPQGRGKIERFFGTINTELLASLPGHLGPGSRKPQPSLDLPGLDQAIGAFIAVYNERPHQELGHSPRDVWVSDGWLPRMPDSLELLDGLLLTVPKHRTVQRDGIHFQGQRYLAPTLAPFVGHTVTIRYDPRDISEIRVYDHDTFICTAVDEAHPNLRLSLRDIESARRARRRELRRTINERIPAAVTREEPRQTASTPRRRRLRTYEEDES